MSSVSLSSASSGSITVTPLSPPHLSDGVPPAVVIASGSRPAEPAVKRKRGRPRKDESSRGKAPMDPVAPKRGRGRPRKDKPFVPQTETSPHLITFDEFHENVWENYHRFQLQGDRIFKLEEELGVAKDQIARHEIMFQKLEMYCRKMKESVADVISHLEKTSGYKPSTPLFLS